MKPIHTRSWSTPLMIASSSVIALSGLMLFFHLGEGLVKSMHEWLGILFIAAILLHILNHSTSLLRYFREKRALLVMAAVLSLAFTWVASNGSKEEHPAKRLVASVNQAPLSVVSQLQQENRDDLVARLRAAGIRVDSPRQSLAELASANHRNPFELLDIILKGKQPAG